MTVKKQILTIKENWLLVLVLVILVSLPLFSGSNVISSTGLMKGVMLQSFGFDEAEYSLSGTSSRYYSDSGFAPEVEDRVITKTSTVTSEIEHGNYFEAENKLKEIIDLTDSYLLNENVNKQEIGWKAYYIGNYQIKVESSKYLSMISQLKEIGEVTSFNENTVDVTGRYTDLKNELSSEKERLTRYESMYSEATQISDKLTLNDRIFDQERRVKYLQDSINRIDQRVDYSTIYFNLREERSDYANIALVKFSTLLSRLVSSFNGLLGLIFWLIPYALILLIVSVIYKRVR